MTNPTPAIVIGVPKESHPDEGRVALIPASVPALVKVGCRVLVEASAGLYAGFPDAEYQARGAEIAGHRKAVFDESDVIFHLLALGANREAGAADLPLLREGQLIIGFCASLAYPRTVAEYAKHGVSLRGMELVPRVTRAQSMDALSSMAAIAGYKAVMLASEALPRMVPLLMTAAGTLTAAKFLIMGAGVSGLQAIATAKRWGGLVKAYDVRPEVKEQVESVGAKFVELPLDTQGASGEGGYAKAMGEEFYKKQRELLAQVVAESDVVITTANVPGGKAPVLVTREMLQGMRYGSVAVDLAAERGGNIEGTEAGKTVTIHGVKVIGPVNIASTVPHHASQMYSKNISTFFLHLLKANCVGEGRGERQEDEITRETLILNKGQIAHPKVKALLGNVS